MSQDVTTAKRPSVAELQSFIRAGSLLRFKAIDGEEYRGSLKWFDDQAFSLELTSGETFTLLKRAVVGYGQVDS